MRAALLVVLLFPALLPAASGDVYLCSDDDAVLFLRLQDVPCVCVKPGKVPPVGSDCQDPCVWSVCTDVLAPEFEVLGVSCKSDPQLKCTRPTVPLPLP